MKVDQILKVWSLLSPKILISSKQVVLKMCMARNPAAPLIYANAPPKFFSKGKFIKRFGVFWKACIVTFQKSNICPNKFLETFQIFKKIHFRSLNFQQISTLVPNLTMKFNKICGEILVVKSTTHKVSETLSCVKIYPLELKISSI